MIYFLQLYFDVEPEVLEFTPDIPQSENGDQADFMIDSFRHVYLGKQPLAVKECSR